MRSVKEITEQIRGIHETMKHCHEEIDDYFSGRNCSPLLGFGPYAQSRVIGNCNKKLEVLKKELMDLGFTEDYAAGLTREPPASGYIFKKCVAFLEKYGG